MSFKTDWHFNFDKTRGQHNQGIKKVLCHFMSVIKNPQKLFF